MVIKMRCLSSSLQLPVFPKVSKSASLKRQATGAVELNMSLVAQHLPEPYTTLQAQRFPNPHPLNTLLVERDLDFTGKA